MVVVLSLRKDTPDFREITFKFCELNGVPLYIGNLF